jgi:hypothetical protein
MPFTASSPPSGSPDQPVSKLRGAGAAVDAKTAGRVLVAVVVLTLGVLVVVFTVVGVHKNSQIDELHDHGVPVTFTVDRCIGLLGGSGSNGAGYACTGTYELAGHRYHEPLPGNDYHAPGTTVQAVAVPSDPTLVSTAAIVRTDQASARVYILPGVLFALLVTLLAVILLTRRRRRRGDGIAAQPASGVVPT